MVKSNKLYGPQSYLELVTGSCYIIGGDDDIESIEEILIDYDLTLWNYPLEEIDHIVENDLDVVLVDCMVWNKEIDEFDHEYRWFEVPNDINITGEDE